MKEELLPELLARRKEETGNEVMTIDDVLKENTSLQLRSTAFGNTNPHFSSFILSLLKLFRADRNLLDTKGSFIIR